MFVLLCAFGLFVIPFFGGRHHPFWGFWGCRVQGLGVRVCEAIGVFSHPAKGISILLGLRVELRSPSLGLGCPFQRL